MKSSIAIIGAGRVGTTTAYTLILKNLVSELLIVDIDKDRSEGEVRDLRDTLAFYETSTVKTATIKQARHSDIIIITAGKAQDPGEDRLNLIKTNKKIVSSIIKELEPINPDAIIIIVTNPVDLMTLVAQKSSSLPKTRIIGSGTWLDTQRLRRYIGEELNIAPESVNAFVIGEHGDSQFVPWSQASISGIPIDEIYPKKEYLKIIEDKTKKEAYLIIEKKKSTHYGIAACLTDICEMIIFDQKRIVPVSGYMPKLDVCLSIPFILGKNGIERGTMIKFLKEEKDKLLKSAKKLKSII